MEPTWLSIELVMAIHNELIAMFGGAAGVRDWGLLESTLNGPRNAYAYGEPSVHQMAAIYAYAIVRNHPFVDGNKRIGLMCIRAFLFQNGYAFEPTEQEEVTMMVATAEGNADEIELSQWISDRTTRND